MELLQPEGWRRPCGYSNGIKVDGTMVFIAGQVGWDRNCLFVSDKFPDQARQALENIVTILNEGNAKTEHLVRMTWYVRDIREYRATKKEIGRIYREVIGNHYPVMTLIQVGELVDEGAKVEIEATAVIPRTE